MDIAEAINQLRSMCAADSHPVLDDSAILLALDAARRPDQAGNSPANTDQASAHAVATEFAAGAVIKVGTRWWRAVVTATTGATAPSWPDLDGYPARGSRVVDGDMTWIDNGAEWAPTWSLRTAAAEVWARKAAVAAGDYDFGTDGQTFSRGQVIDHCLRMERRYRAGSSRSIEVTRC